MSKYLLFNLPMTIGITHASNLLQSKLTSWGIKHNIKLKFNLTYQCLGLLIVQLPSDRAYELFCLSWDGDSNWQLKLKSASDSTF